MRCKAGYRISRVQVVRAKCCECMANYADGRVDCKHVNCPIYAKHRFRRLQPNFDWVFGKWTKRHKKAAFVHGMTEEEYIKNFVWVNQKYKLGYNAIFRAKCYDCNADFIDGRIDCEIQSCALYFWMPYRELEPTYDWLFDFNWTRKHNQDMFIEGLSRPEYLDQHFDYVSP